MSQLVFQSTAGGSITFVGASTSTAFLVNVPASNGTLVYIDGSNNTALTNLTVSGTSSFSGASTFGSTTSFAGTATFALGASFGASVSFAGLTCSADATFSGTGEIKIPAGTTAQRSGTPATGMIRYNTSYSQFEGYNGSAWGIIGGGATGSSGDQIFVLNGQTVTANYTIPSGKNASTAGAITINTGIVVTVSTGSRWVIV
jgi:hypothetical protein